MRPERAALLQTAGQLFDEPGCETLLARRIREKSQSCESLRVHTVGGEDGERFFRDLKNLGGPAALRKRR